MTNEETYSEYIKELVAKEGDISLNPAWVIGILGEISHCYKYGIFINPEYLRAHRECCIIGTPRPKDIWVFRKETTTETCEQFNESMKPLKAQAEALNRILESLLEKVKCHACGKPLPEGSSECPNCSKLDVAVLTFK